ncbi:MAG: hypothetical protein CM15mP23_07080 [Cryomorphaceae bacterium]|nr:MAG: hypothetical protein CM15mP23_07080 [Cryomorphaceae bacterium]
MTYVCFFSIPETLPYALLMACTLWLLADWNDVPVQGGLGPYHAAVTLGIVSWAIRNTRYNTCSLIQPHNQ